MGSMSECSKIIGYILAWIALLLSIATIATPEWRKNDVQGEVVETIIRTQGLWWKCTFYPTGNWQCDDYDRFFIALPTAVIGARVFCMLSLVFQLIVIVVVPLGFQACMCIDKNVVRNKQKIIITAGALSLLAGCCIGTAVSWYAALVVEDYSRYATGLSAGIETTVQRFVYGHGLYLGWAAMSCNFIQGIAFCCSSWGGHDDEYKYEEEMDMIEDMQSNKPLTSNMQGANVDMNVTQPTFVQSVPQVVQQVPVQTQYVPVQQVQQVPVQQAYLPTYQASVAGSRTRYM